MNRESAFTSAKFTRRELFGGLAIAGVAAALSGCGSEKIRVDSHEPTHYYKGKVIVDPSLKMQMEYDGFWEYKRKNPEWSTITSVYNQTVDLINPFVIEDPLITLHQSDSGALYHLLNLPVLYIPDGARDVQERESTTLLINMDPSDGRYEAPVPSGVGYLPIISDVLNGGYYQKNSVSGEAVGEPLKYGLITQPGL